MTNQIANLKEREAFEILKTKKYDKSAILLYELYKEGGEDYERHLTHACYALWDGVQESCHSAGKIYICGMTNIRDANYACQLFIACLFKLRRETPKISSPLSELICETVIRIESILKFVISSKDSTYAMTWLADVQRGMASYNECNKLINNALSKKSLPENHAKTLINCRDGIPVRDKDSAFCCTPVKRAFPKMETVSELEVKKIHDVVTLIWKNVCSTSIESNHISDNVITKQNTVSAAVNQEKASKFWWQFWK